MNNELVKLGEKTYVVLNSVNIGIYLLDDNNVCVIDTGSSKDYAKMIDKILINNNWNLKYIINTHSHADHINGNNYLQNKYQCKIYSNVIESYFINSPFLESALMYGANPIKGLNNHILCAKESVCDDIDLLNDNVFNIIDLNGHSPGLIGIVTPDNICFVGDTYTDKSIIEKYAIQYIYDIDNYLKSLNFLLNSNYTYYIPSHGKIENKNDAFNTILKNKEICLKIKDNIINIIGDIISYDELIAKIFKEYNININTVQYYVIKATIKSYITSLEKDNKIEIVFNNNIMYIKSI